MEFLSYSEEICSSEKTIAVYFSVVISSYLHALFEEMEVEERNKQIITKLINVNWDTYFTNA